MTYFAIVSWITSVHVARQSTAQKRMVQTSVEFYFIDAVLGFDFDSSKFFIPFFMSCFFYRIKSLTFRFCFQIQFCIFNTRIGKSHLHFYNFIFFGGEVHVHSVSNSFSFCFIIESFVFYKRTVGFRSFVHLNHKIHFHTFFGITEFQIFRIGFYCSLQSIFT
ncbi:hypothetical protein D3C86_1300900 [compost metagenome]